jgi:NAD+ synthase (glutamine-hydrolysing)
MSVVALLQHNSVVGDIHQNSIEISRLATIAASQGATIAVTSELAICGYPPRDLLLEKDFVNRCIEAIKGIISPIPILIGSPLNPDGIKKLPSNGVIYCEGNGKIKELYRKQLLPTYDVFDEARYFNKGTELSTIEAPDCSKLGITICEDAWQHAGHVPSDYGIDPIKQLSKISKQLSYSVNLSASPYHADKKNVRIDVVKSAAASLKHPYLMCNQIGGNDDLIFDGRSTISWPNGDIMQAPAWKEAILLVDLNKPQLSKVIEFDNYKKYDGLIIKEAKITPSDDNFKNKDEDLDLLEAITTGLRDYCHKSGIKSVVLGVSGGIDSAVTAAIACRALGPGAVHGISMPMRYSSKHSKKDAKELMNTLGAHYHQVELSELQISSEEYLKELIPINDPGVDPIYLENIQARLRGLTVMAYANAYGGMALATGNKSELAIGYCTLYGDMCGGYAPLGDLYKTEVYRIANLINREAEENGEEAPIPKSTIVKPPSAELRPNQKDEDSLPPYESLDAILEDWIERGIVNTEYDEKTVSWILQTMKSNEHKRWQMPPAPRVSKRSFGQGWRQPLAAKK